MSLDTSLPTALREVPSFEELPNHIQARAEQIAQLQLSAEVLAKQIEDRTEALNIRKNEIDRMKSELETLKSDLRTECRRHVVNNL